MASTLAQVVEELNSVLAPESQLKPWEKSDKVLTLVADFLIQALARNTDKGRVGVLMVIPGSNHLTFAYPRHLAKGNVIPIDVNSFAGRCLTRKEVLVENSVASEPHLDFYERVRDSAGRTASIQKMITAPLVTAEGRAIGVIQVSRVGTTPPEAGPDFTPMDANNLAKGCKILAPYIARAWTRERP